MTQAHPITYLLSEQGDADIHEAAITGSGVPNDDDVFADLVSEHGSLPTEMFDTYVDRFTIPGCCLSQVPEVQYNAEQCESQLHQSWLALAPNVAMPWDLQNVNSIYGFAGVFTRPRPAPYPVVQKKSNPLEDELKGQDLARASIRIKNIKPKADTAIRSVAISKWLKILNSKPSCFKLGRFLLSQASMIVSDEAIQLAISDVVSMKATRTLSKRAADMMRFVLWATSSNVECLPPTESSVYAYFSFLRSVGASAGAFTSAKSAIAFAGSVFGLDNALESLNSPMIKGIVDAESLKKPKRKPKPPLTADSIRVLESLQLQSPAFADRLFAGFCIFCTLYK